VPAQQVGDAPVARSHRPAKDLGVDQRPVLEADVSQKCPKSNPPPYPSPPRPRPGKEVQHRRSALVAEVGDGVDDLLEQLGIVGLNVGQAVTPIQLRIQP